MSIDEIQESIIEEMRQLDGWMERYAYLIDLGKRLEADSFNIRTEENLIKGCQSQVWVSGVLTDGLMHFAADSDAAITRGVIALALRVFDRQPPAAILDAHLYVFRDTGLESNLSPARANGLASIVSQIRELARATGASG